MKIVRLRQPGGARHGILDGSTVHLTSSFPRSMADATGETVPLDAAELLAPTVPGKIMAVGRNYADHIAEMGYEVPDRPSLFMKPPNAVVATNGVVVLPPTHLSNHVEHEAELAVVMGRPARSIAPEDALSHVLGFTCADDVSARDLQRSDDSVVRGKGFDTFCPLGPCIETELDLVRGVAITCRVNGELRQDGHTSNLLFDVPHLISYLSQFTTLLPGDVVLTGSPGGSGPLAAGDQVEIEVPEIGTLRHSVQ